MPLSGDPDARARQLANLRTSAALTHGARSGEIIRTATREHLASLSAQFPSATTEELTVQAIRMAQIERLSAYVEQMGLIRNRREGTVFEAGRLLSQLSSAFERQAAVLLARQQAAGATGGDTIESIAAEYAAKRQLTEGNGDGG